MKPRVGENSEYINFCNGCVGHSLLNPRLGCAVISEAYDLKKIQSFEDLLIGHQVLESYIREGENLGGSNHVVVYVRNRLSKFLELHAL